MLSDLLTAPLLYPLVVIVAGLAIVVAVWLFNLTYRALVVYLFLLPLEVYVSAELRITSNQLFQLLLITRWALLLLYVWRANRGIVNVTPLHLLSISLVIYVVVSMAWSANPTASLRSLYRLLAAISMFWIVVSIVQVPRQVERLLTALCLGGVVIAVYGLRQYQQGNYGAYYHLFSPFYSEVFYSRGNGISIVATFSNPNIMACFGAPLVSLMIGKVYASPVRHKWFWLLAVAFLMTALTVTYSKNAWVQMAIIILVWGIFKTSRQFKLVLALLCMIAGLVYIARTESVMEQFQALFPRDYEISIAPRIQLWNIALQVISARPFTGYGLDGFAAATLEMRTGVYLDLTRTHNLYLQMLADIGLIGFTLLYGLALLIFSYGIKAYYRSTSNHSRALLLSLLIAMLSLFIGGLFETPISSNAYVSLQWIIWGLTFALARTVLQHGPATATFQPLRLSTAAISSPTSA